MNLNRALLLLLTEVLLIVYHKCTTHAHAADNGPIHAHMKEIIPTNQKHTNRPANHFFFLPSLPFPHRMLSEALEVGNGAGSRLEEGITEQPNQ